MKVKLTAPVGYKYKDTKTGKLHSEVIVDYKDKKRFVLVADKAEKIMEV